MSDCGDVTHASLSTLCTRMAALGAGRGLTSGGPAECCDETSNDCTDDASDSRAPLLAAAGARSWDRAAGGGTAMCFTDPRESSVAGALLASGATALGGALGDVLGELGLGGTSEVRGDAFSRGICDCAAGSGVAAGLQQLSACHAVLIQTAWATPRPPAASLVSASTSDTMS